MNARIFSGAAEYLLVLSLLCAGLFVNTPVFAASQIDVYHFDSEEQRQRYKALIDEFRCPKCINTNLSGSDAPIAQDLRRTVHRLVVEEGYSNQQVRDFLQERYGDFVLYDPPFNANTWLIWIFPILILICGVLVLLRLRGSDADEEPLDEEARASQRAQVQALLDTDRDPS